MVQRTVYVFVGYVDLRRSMITLGELRVIVQLSGNQRRYVQVFSHSYALLLELILSARIPRRHYMRLHHDASRLTLLGILIPLLQN